MRGGKGARIKIGLKIAAALAALLVGYVCLLIYPYPFFPYELTYANIHAYSNEPIPSELTAILKTADARLQRSPLNLPEFQHRVFFCATPTLFAFFANRDYRVGGLNEVYFNDNVFIRPADIRHDRIIRASGRVLDDGRTLAYYVTHEIAHTLERRHLGLYRFWRLPSWKREGYADYVGKGGLFDYGRAVELLRCGDKAMDPKRSGLYLRNHLLTAHLIDKRGVSVETFLTSAYDPKQLAEDILASVPEAAPTAEPPGARSVRERRSRQP
jgi:hypothetical protein